MRNEEKCNYLNYTWLFLFFGLIWFIVFFQDGYEEIRRNIIGITLIIFGLARVILKIWILRSEGEKRIQIPYTLGFLSIAILGLFLILNIEDFDYRLLYVQIAVCCFSCLILHLLEEY